MLRTNLYLTEEQNNEIVRLAVATKRPKAAVLRHLIVFGLKNSSLAKFNSTQDLLKLASLAETLPGKGPVDLSANLDKYAWDE
jgi:hypothetical protein